MLKKIPKKFCQFLLVFGKGLIVMFRLSVLGILLVFLFLVPIAFAAPSAEILMEKTTYGYGEKLVYTIQVSEVTGDIAIVHIRDESGKGSSAIPIPVTELKTEVPSLYPFEKEIFPDGWRQHLALAPGFPERPSQRVSQGQNMVAHDHFRGHQFGFPP